MSPCCGCYEGLRLYDIKPGLDYSQVKSWSVFQSTSESERLCVECWRVSDPMEGAVALRNCREGDAESRGCRETNMLSGLRQEKKSSRDSLTVSCLYNQHP